MNQAPAETLEDKEPETTDLTPAEPETMSTDGMEDVIAVSSKMESYAKAMDTITNHIIKRSYPGDWVCHAKASDAEGDRRANIGAAAAERIAMFLGIQERDWTPGEKTKSDEGKYYTWSFQAEFGFGKRWIRAIGRASSQDKFFGYEYGKWKAIEDVKEDDVRMAAFRACRKEGVRALLGLRAIPLSKLKELGYDISKVHMVNRDTKGKALDEASKTVDASTGLAKKVITVKEIKPFPWSKPEEKDSRGTVVKKARSGVRMEVWDIEGVKFTLWCDDISSERYLALTDAMNAHDSIEIEFQTKKTDKGDSYEIVKVSGAVDK